MRELTRDVCTNASSDAKFVHHGCKQRHNQSSKEDNQSINQSICQSNVPAPQKAISDLPHWICSNPVPMQCAPVLQADEMLKDGPCV